MTNPNFQTKTNGATEQQKSFSKNFKRWKFTEFISGRKEFHGYKYNIYKIIILSNTIVNVYCHRFLHLSIRLCKNSITI